MIYVLEENGVAIRQELEQLKQFMGNEEFIHYVGMLIPPRPGVSECIALLEHRHFKPGTVRNHLLIMHMISWSEIIWSIASIPIAERSKMEEVADECGLRAVEGVPAMISGEGMDVFPVDNERTYTFENKADHPVFRNDPELNDKMIEAEFRSIERITRSK